MNVQDNLDRQIASWLAEGPHRLPEAAIDQIVGEIEQTDTRKLTWLPRRETINRTIVAAGSLAAVVLLAVLGFGLVSGGGVFGPGATASPSPTPTVAVATSAEPIEATPSASPANASASPPPSSSPFTERFDSPLHGISIGYPAGWQTRPATEPWNHGAVAFDAPNVDVIFDPTLQDDLYFALVSEPLGGRAPDDWCCSEPPASAGICDGSDGGGGGAYILADAEGWVASCGGPAGGHSLTVATDTHGYIVYLHVADDLLLRETYDWDWFEAALETVDLHP